jgi:hypothetical protein
MIRKEIFIGFLAGIAGNAIGVCLFSLLVVDGGVAKTLAAAHEKKLLGSFVALGALLNLFIFFGFIRKRSDYKARGVLMATIIVAVLSGIYKLVVTT